MHPIVLYSIKHINEHRRNGKRQSFLLFRLRQYSFRVYTTLILQDSYLFRPYCSWLDTQSDELIADASEISPANTTDATISANLPTVPLP